MTAEVVKFYPNNAAESADMVLEQAMGGFSEVLLIGLDNEGALDVRATLGIEDRDLLWLIEVFKAKLLAGDYAAPCD